MVNKLNICKWCANNMFMWKHSWHQHRAKSLSIPITIDRAWTTCTQQTSDFCSKSASSFVFFNLLLLSLLALIYAQREREREGVIVTETVHELYAGNMQQCCASTVTDQFASCRSKFVDSVNMLQWLSHYWRTCSNRCRALSKAHLLLKPLQPIWRLWLAFACVARGWNELICAVCVETST